MLAPWKSGRHDCGPVKLLSHLLQLARTHRPRTTPKRAGNRVLPAASRPSLVAIACVGTHLVHTLGRTLARINLRRRRGVRACKAAAGDSFVSEKTRENQRDFIVCGSSLLRDQRKMKDSLLDLWSGQSNEIRLVKMFDGWNLRILMFRGLAGG